MLLNHKLSLQDADVVSSANNSGSARRWASLNCLTLEIARKAGHLPLGTCDRDRAKPEGAQRLKSL
jgi:hypothetical protein